VTVDTAISYIQELGSGCLLSKIDVANAFRIIPVSPNYWPLLGLFWNNRFYVDTRLQMGSRSSPSLFDNLSVALEWICKNNYRISHICHLLDDFLGVELLSKAGNFLDVVLKLCNKCNIPIAPGKVEGPATCLEFLGITLDTVLMEARLSLEKICKLKNLLNDFQSKKKCTKREILSLIGSLSFACKVIVPGRPFLARLINLSCTVKALHQFIYLNSNVKADVSMWHSFLDSWNGKTFFLSKTVSESPSIEFYTDASGKLGYGAYFQGSWFALPWLSHQAEYSMSAKELLPIIVAAHLWGFKWKNMKIKVHCDNEATVKILNKGYSSKKPIAEMVRSLMLCSMTYNFLLKAVHIPGKNNIKADLLSRFQINRFHHVTPEADRLPTPLSAIAKTLSQL